jgi:hypothetical protein
MRLWSHIEIRQSIISLMILVSCMNAVYCDPLDPIQLGETMNMLLPPELLQRAASAGITKGVSQYSNNPLASGSSGANLGIPITASSDPTHMEPSGTALNINGNLLLILQGEASGNYLNLILHQNHDSVLGHGNMISGNSFQNVTANGLTKNGKLSLTIDPDGGSESYKLELQPDGNTITGSYDVQYTNGTTFSGKAIGILPNNSIKIQSSSNQPQQNSVKTISRSSPLSTSSTGIVPVLIGHGSTIGSTFSSSKNINMGASSGGSMVSSTSSTTF